MDGKRPCGIEARKRACDSIAHSDTISEPLCSNAEDMIPACPNTCPQLGAALSMPCTAIAAMADAHALTRREREALVLVCEGLKNDAIAERMGVTTDTVRLHLRNLHKKTGTADKVELVLFAWRFCVKHTGKPFQE